MNIEDIKKGTIFSRKRGFDPEQNDIFVALIIGVEKSVVEIKILKSLTSSPIEHIQRDYKTIQINELTPHYCVVEGKRKITLKDMLGENEDAK